MPVTGEKGLGGDCRWALNKQGVVIGHFSDGEKERAMRSERPRLLRLG